jgi:hypothetical protein
MAGVTLCQVREARGRHNVRIFRHPAASREIQMIPVTRLTKYFRPARSLEMRASTSVPGSSHGAARGLLALLLAQVNALLDDGAEIVEIKEPGL